MKINFLSVKDTVPAEGYWDHALIKDLLEDLPEGDRQVFVIPGAYQSSEDVVDKINKKLSKHKKVMVFVTSDEEGKFDCKKLAHPDIIHYHQYGYCENLFPIGYTTETRKILKEIGLQKPVISVFFAGQLNSIGRQELFSKLAFIPNSFLLGTNGFSVGLPPKDYYSYMARSVIVPCPGGHISPDSFRFYEALEAGCIPRDYPDYIKKMFPYIPEGETFAWWIAKKVEMRDRLRKELGCPLEPITAIVTTSPIPSHPSTDIIDTTINSIRHHLDSNIIIGIDGVRPEQANKTADYEEYKRKLLWKCNFEYKNVVPIVFDSHQHQSGMMKKILPMVDTPLLLFVEHDTPLVTDKDIDWGYLTKRLLKQDYNYIRFHYQSKITPEHEYLMVGKPENYVLKTRQWSQRPHLARTDFYNTIIKHFSDKANCFIEDRVYTLCVDDNWNNWKLGIYYPKGSIERSLNLDGRKDDPKFEGEQIW